MELWSRLALTCINLDMKGPSPRAISVVDESANVLHTNVAFIRSALVAGIMSFQRPLIWSSRGGKRPSLMALERLSLAPGISLGYANSDRAVSSRTRPPKKYPTHQAPIQRGSSGVKSTPGGWDEIKQELHLRKMFRYVCQLVLCSYFVTDVI